MSAQDYNFSPYIGLPVMAMGFVVVLSNNLVQYPINDWLTWGAFSYPLCFLVNDITNRRYGLSQAKNAIYAGFIVGVFLSIFASDLRIAVASGVAFLLAQMLDATLFNRLRRMVWWKAPLFSSLMASLLDSILFFGIAFMGTGLPWISWGVGDFAVKVFMGFMLLFVFRLLSRKMPVMA